MEVKELQKKAAYVRFLALMAMQKAGASFTGSAMSSVEILTSLYYGTLNHQPLVKFDKKKPGWSEQDYVILSKVTAAAVQYAILADLGFFSVDELDFMSGVNTLLKPRPVNKVPGVTLTAFNGGSGLSMAVGLAMSLKMEKLPNRVYVLLDAVELQNGQTWEAMTAAAHYKLNNLVVFVDDCTFQVDGATRAVMDLAYLQTKFDSFGAQVIHVNDGHDFDQILNAVVKSYNTARKPIFVWCKTVSGKGIDFAERKHGYFSAAFTEPEFFEAKQRLSRIFEDKT